MFINITSYMYLLSKENELNRRIYILTYVFQIKQIVIYFLKINLKWCTIIIYPIFSQN